jgi:hypothetical protein
MGLTEKVKALLLTTLNLLDYDPQLLKRSGVYDDMSFVKATYLVTTEADLTKRAKKGKSVWH